MSFAVAAHPRVSGGASFEITPSYFAEFLKLHSLALLSLLDLTTCVGYRYDLISISLRNFSGAMNPALNTRPKPHVPITTQINGLSDLPIESCFVA